MDETLWGKRTDKTSLSRWVAKQCHGLAEGLSQFHQFQGHAGDDHPRPRGMHGDIKPNNTLWYKNWLMENDRCGIAQSEPGTALEILPIADFGLSNFYYTGSVYN